MGCCTRPCLAIDHVAPTLRVLVGPEHLTRCAKRHGPLRCGPAPPRHGRCTSRTARGGTWRPIPACALVLSNGALGSIGRAPAL
eukprot:11203987-Lingulodinium_polyedra.AAC.1